MILGMSWDEFDKELVSCEPLSAAECVERLQALADREVSEEGHMLADAYLCRYIMATSPEIVAAFQRVRKWYS